MEKNHNQRKNFQAKLQGACFFDKNQIIRFFSAVCYQKLAEHYNLVNNFSAQIIDAEDIQILDSDEK